MLKHITKKYSPNRLYDIMDLFSKNTVTQVARSLDDIIDTNRKLVEYETVSSAYIDSLKKIALLKDDQSILEALRSIILSKVNDATEISFAIRCMYQKYPEEGVDILKRLTMLLTIYDNMDNLVILDALNYVVTIEPNILSIEEQLEIGVCLYNEYYITESYEIMIYTLKKSMKDTNLRLACEACKFLMASEEVEHKKIVTDTLFSIYDNPKIKTVDKYDIILDYAKSQRAQGVMKVFSNKEPLRVKVEKEFVITLYEKFFYHPLTDMSCQLLVAQYLLPLPDYDTSPIEQYILKYCENDEAPEDIRADAADTLLRYGKTTRLRAREILAEIGYSVTTVKGVSSKGYGKNRTVRIKTLSNNSQNLHLILEKYVTEYMEHLIESLHPDPSGLPEVMDSIKKAAMKLERKARDKVTRSLKRITTDLTTFTKYGITLSEVLLYVWERMKKFSDDKEVELNIRKRLIDELEDMADTCTTGHFVRLLNVFAGYDEVIRISWKTQISSNTMGRIQHKISKLSDKDKDAISISMLFKGVDDEELSSEDKESIDTYKTYIPKYLKEVKKELVSEFVDEKYISREEFKIIWKKIKEEWLL